MNSCDERLMCFELRAAMRICGLSQRQLAALTGVAPNTVWRWCDGTLDVPKYVGTMLSLFRGDDPWALVEGSKPAWTVEVEDVYRPRDTFKSLSLRWHPDRTRRDTNREIQLILSLRDAAARVGHASSTSRKATPAR